MISDIPFWYISSGLVYEYISLSLNRKISWDEREKPIMLSMVRKEIRKMPREYRGDILHTLSHDIGLIDPNIKFPIRISPNFLKTENIRLRILSEEIQ